MLYRMAYTLGQAAKAVGRTKGAIQQAIAGNKISATKDEFGRWQIDPAELHRLYPPKKPQLNDAEYQPDTGYTAEIERLNGTVEGLERLCRQIENERDSLRVRLDQSEQERRDKDRQLTALLTDQREQTAPAKRRWWSFGKRA